MLSAVERKQQYADLMDNLAQQLGVRIVLDIEVTKLQGPNGPVFQSVPVMRLVADAVWPPVDSPQGEKDSTQRHKDAKTQSDFVEPQIQAESVEAGIEAGLQLTEELKHLVPDPDGEGD